MTAEIADGKLDRLRQAVARYPSALVCYSGGVDSTLLATVARQVLGEGMSAVTVNSPLLPPREFERATSLASMLGFPLRIIAADELSLPDFRNNPDDRCYLCKRHRLTLVIRQMKSEGFAVVLDGSNADDALGHRPGRKAVEELGGVSPLEAAGFSKRDVRQAARDLALPNWNQPSRPCLATRFHHGVELKPELLRMVDAAEEALEGLGLREFRVRLEGRDWARIEVGGHDPALLVEKENRERLVKKFKDLGFRRILLDLEGYRSGIMDEA
ncbi:MAG: TIGR00268 family protein [Candidatus Solincola sediminis]|uniref:TIGR00268 family protein n=1 Tax=Candidatus Solincola sediminis TaxID=1797199 RepID=A0A1F2WRE9_9ACTN|nr:MAG: TIGR00268 family protein [Candidatus Solincola sediminis]